MNRRSVGWMVLLVALSALLVVPRLIAPGLAGRPTMAALPDPPLVGQCLTQTMQVVDCGQPHRWEVTARWFAADPTRIAAATSEACDQRAATYGNLAAVSTVDRWNVTTAIVAAVLQAPSSQRSGAQGWSICTIQPAWVDLRAGSLGTITRLADAPELFSLCLGYFIGEGGIDCHQIHDVQLLGTTQETLPSGTPDPASQIRQRMEESCRRLGATVMAVSDPTYDGQLSLRVDFETSPAVNAGDSAYVVRCFVTPKGGRLLNGTVTALGNQALPLA